MFLHWKKEQCCVFYIISSFVSYDPLALRKIVISQLTRHSWSIKWDMRLYLFSIILCLCLSSALKPFTVKIQPKIALLSILSS